VPATQPGALMRISYLVHDLHDAAVARRIALLRGQGAQVRVAGFRRRDAVPGEIAGAPAVDLGRTRDGKLLARVWSVLRHCLAPRRLRAETATADVLVARNLEALVLAARVRTPGQRLVYECLDIIGCCWAAGRRAGCCTRSRTGPCAGLTCWW